MSDPRFQNRLRRNGANTPRPKPTIDPARARKLRRQEGGGGFRATIGVVMIVVGSQMIKHTNQNYETIKAAGGLGMAVGFALIGIIIWVIGIVMAIRGFFASRR